MKRKSMIGWQGHAVSALGILVTGALALVLSAGYPVTSVILLLAMAAGLAGIGHRWRRDIKRKRQRMLSRELRI